MDPESQAQPEGLDVDVVDMELVREAQSDETEPGGLSR